MRFLLLAGLWLVLTAGDAGAWLPGLLAAAAAAALSARLLPPAPQRLRWGAAAGLVLRFLWGSLLGGFDVARRALDPRRPLRAGWVRHPLQLPAGAPRMLLGDLISLMPGTLAAGEDGPTLLVHCFDAGEARLHEVAQREQEFRQAAGEAARPHG